MGVEMVQLCLGLVKGMDMDPREQLRHIKAAGFDGFFALWEAPGQLDRLAAEAKALGLTFQSVHAPFRKTSALWEPGEAGDAALRELLACLDDCRRLGVPVMVSHVFMGFEVKTPGDLGLQRFSRLFDAAKDAGIKIALENVESIPHLQYLLDRYPEPHVGLCWDSGHAHCYNSGYDLLGMYGHRLMATHLNDNFGMADRNVMTWHDDSHVMPFDGINDWKSIIDRMDRAGYDGIYTMELTRNAKPNKNTHDIYAHMNVEQFMAEALDRMHRMVALRG